MAVEQKDYLTPEQVYNNYEYKVARKLLMGKFPFVTDIRLDNPEQLNEYGLVFIVLVLDVAKVFEYYEGCKPSGLIDWYYRRGEVNIPYLSLLVDNECEDDVRDTTREMDNMLESLHKSPAIPEELKLPRNRRFAVGGFDIIKK